MILNGTGAYNTNSKETVNNELNKNLRQLNTNICCLKESILNNKEYAPILRCSPDAPGDIVIGTFYFNGTDWSLSYYNADGTPYTGNPPISCLSEVLESDPLDICINGAQATQWVVKRNGVPTGQLYYTNLAGTVLATPSSFTKGLCPDLEFLQESHLISQLTLETNASFSVNGAGDGEDFTCNPVITDSYPFTINDRVKTVTVIDDGVKTIYDTSISFLTVSQTIIYKPKNFSVYVIYDTYKGAQLIYERQYQYGAGGPVPIAVERTLSNSKNAYNAYGNTTSDVLNYQLPTGTSVLSWKNKITGACVYTDRCKNVISIGTGLTLSDNVHTLNPPIDPILLISQKENTYNTVEHALITTSVTYAPNTIHIFSVSAIAGTVQVTLNSGTPITIPNGTSITFPATTLLSTQIRVDVSGGSAYVTLIKP